MSKAFDLPRKPYVEILWQRQFASVKNKVDGRYGLGILKPNSYKKLFNDVELSKIELAIFQRNVLDFV